MTTETAAQWDALVAGEADAAPESPEGVSPDSFMQEGDIINAPSSEAPLAMRLSELRYKGYVRVWNTKTGDTSLQPWWLLWQTFRKKHPDGSLVFTRTDPKIPPNHGEDWHCPMNPNAPDDPRFVAVKTMGFKECKKQHIPHLDALYQHLRKSHKRAWDAMERDEEERTREEGLSLQRESIATQQAFMKELMAQRVEAGTARIQAAPPIQAAPRVQEAPPIEQHIPVPQDDLVQEAPQPPSQDDLAEGALASLEQRAGIQPAPPSEAYLVCTRCEPSRRFAGKGKTKQHNLARHMEAKHPEAVPVSNP
jgi:hypothetical protein